MSVPDVALRVRLATEAYSPALYAFTFFDSVDIYRVLLAEKLIPKRSGAEEEVSRWFINPADAFRDPALVVDAMGTERWEALATHLETMLTIYDEEVSPLHIALAKFRLPKAAWLPLLRWLASEGCEGDFKPLFSSFIVSIANGNGPAGLMLPKGTKDRYIVVGQLLLAAAKEFGRVNVGSFASELMLSVGYKMTFRDQKALMHVLARSTRRGLDWQLRQSGEILNAIGDWRSKYLSTTDGQMATAPVRLETADDDDSIEDKQDRAQEGEESDVEFGMGNEEEDASAQTDFSRGIAVDESIVHQPRTAEVEDEGVADEEEAATREAKTMAKLEAQEDIESAALGDDSGDELATDVDSYFSAMQDDEASGRSKHVAAFFKPDKRASDATQKVSKLLADLPTMTRAQLLKERKAALKRAGEDDAAAFTVDDGLDLTDSELTADKERKRAEALDARRKHLAKSITKARRSWSERVLQSHVGDDEATS